MYGVSTCAFRSWSSSCAVEEILSRLVSGQFLFLVLADDVDCGVLSCPNRGVLLGEVMIAWCLVADEHREESGESNRLVVSNGFDTPSKSSERTPIQSIACASKRVFTQRPISSRFAGPLHAGGVRLIHRFVAEVDPDEFDVLEFCVCLEVVEQIDHVLVDVHGV